ncbi:MAG: preprotein translocase subunit SecY [Candidatus Moraniibacteriota bacterium]
MLKAFRQIFSVPELRGKILFILGVLVVYRFAANIPMPGVDVLALQNLFSQNDILSLLNVFSGGGLKGVSIVLLGVAPYISASIIIQLLTMAVPALERYQKEEGEAGRRKFSMWTRWLTIPLAAVQAFGMITLLRSQGVIADLTPILFASMILTAVAGTIFLMWLGELITEKGLGNGISLLIFAGIVAGMPAGASRFISTWDSTQIFSYILFLAVALIIIVGVVFVNDGQRIIPISYAKRLHGAKVYGGASTHLPLRVNQAGVIPIIFAVSIIVIPRMAATYFAQANMGKVSDIAVSVNVFLQNPWIYSGLYFLLVVVFTYFYTAVIFDPFKIAENLQKQGGFIPGIRPGTATAEYLGKIINRITLSGAVFLGLIAVLPNILQTMTNIQSLTLGGVSILITVSVVIELMKHVEGQLSMRNYEGF